MPNPVVLCILDGWGIGESDVGNAPRLANTPTFDHLMATCPHAELITHGPDVGLPRGQMGNSEVGHTNIGAGRVVAMDLGQIDLAIEDQSFFQSQAILDFGEALLTTGGRAHLLGVISDGGVHGHLNHVIAAANMLVDMQVPVVLHAISDGRDVAPKSALDFFQTLEQQLSDKVQIGTVTGRYFALDRDNRWDRVKTAFDAMVHGTGARAESATGAVDAAYAKDVTDEFVPATVVGDYAGMAEGDGIFCLNFRADRAREILATLCDPDFSAFETGGRPIFAAQLGMVSYSDAHDAYMTAVFPKRDIQNTLGAWVAKHGKRQFRLAETEKYPHVTFFMNGGIEVAEAQEDRFMPPSPKVATYDLEPEMASAAVTDEFVNAIEQGYDLIITNYANPDMVGHTGDLKAAIAACESVDRGLALVVDALEKANGTMILTADHGNCEMMIDPETGGPHTAHTTNPVPVILVNGAKNSHLTNGRLADLAPTLLELMSLENPVEMTGKSLIS